MMICRWCNGQKRLYLKGHRTIDCPNCHGTGIGNDGGRANITIADRSYLKGNKHHIRGRK